MHEVLVNLLGGLSLPRKNVVRLTDRPDMTLDVYRGRKTTMQQQQIQHNCVFTNVKHLLYAVSKFRDVMNLILILAFMIYNGCRCKKKILCKFVSIVLSV